MRLPLTALLLLVSLSMTACHSHPCVKCQAMDNKPYRHVVAFKFNEDATPEQIDQIVKDFGKLQDDIKEIVAFEHGKQVSPEGFDQGYTHIFIVTFENRAGLDVYLPHPAHKAFVEKLLPLLDPPPFVVDYVAE